MRSRGRHLTGDQRQRTRRIRRNRALHAAPPIVQSPDACGITISCRSRRCSSTASLYERHGGFAEDMDRSSRTGICGRAIRWKTTSCSSRRRRRNTACPPVRAMPPAGRSSSTARIQDAVNRATRAARHAVAAADFADGRRLRAQSVAGDGEPQRRAAVRRRARGSRESPRGGIRVVRRSRGVRPAKAPGVVTAAAPRAQRSRYRAARPPGECLRDGGAYAARRRAPSSVR